MLDRFLLCLTLLAAITSQATAQITALFPANGVSNVNPDTPLRLTLSNDAKLGTSGKIQIIDAATSSAVETIDVSARTAKQSIGGMTDFTYYPVIASGNQVTIHPRNGLLAYGKSYYVTADAGALGDVAIEKGKWAFATKTTAPVKDVEKLTVAADGTGDFSTVQAAIDSIPNGNTKPITIFIRKGVYEEIIFITNKHSITLLGEDRKDTIIQYANNEKLNTIIPGNPFAGAKPDPVSFDTVKGPVYHRGMFIAHRCNDLTIANLTLHNTTPQGGSQAEAILINGSTSAHAILKDVDLLSFQDTLQINGQAYLNNCYIEGDVDFMWGTGPVVFENCTCKVLRSNAYYTQIRNQDTNHGFVYIRCTIEGAPGVVANLSRIDPKKYPASEVVFMDCVMTSAVSPVAWALQGGGETPGVHYWEFNSHTADGKPIDSTRRPAFAKQLKQPEDAEIIKNYSDPKFILGGQWDPMSSPNMILHKR